MTHGFTFCLFDVPQSLHDWGTKHLAWNIRHKAILATVRHFTQRFTPDAAVIEDVSAD